MAKVLITGASGFVGGHLAAALVQHGAAVRCLVRPASSTRYLDPLEAEIVCCEPNDAAALQAALADVDTVYHVAGALADRRRGDLRRANVDLAGQFASLCAARPNPPRFIHVSSVAAAGPVPRGTVREPADPPQPVSKYGRSKLEGEKRIAAHAAEMPITVVRPGAVFGERDRASATIFQSIRWWRCHPIVGFRTPPLSVIHVADLVEILLRAADRGQRVSADREEQQTGRGFYFACLEEHPTYAELGAMVRKAVNRRIAVPAPIPLPIAWPIAAINQMLARIGLGNPLFNPDKIREASASSWACSPTATFRDLEFTPPVPFQDRLRQTAEWYRKERWI
ncbi:MAG: NAD(P)-dependent oxidoreductase [Planctomycetes bacterium]|nr:NAD(P)-dependent oxidoreductase [Planctomycetota bacterium]